jgi:hypothetical protein
MLVDNSKPATIGVLRDVVSENPFRSVKSDHRSQH